MDQHRITTSVPEHDMANKELSVKVHVADELRGELIMSRGRVDWHPFNSPYVYRLGWEKFGKVMQDNGRKRKH